VLLLFILAARRLSMSALGVLQYISPSMQFAIGIALGEAFPASRAAAFALIWAGLAIYTFDFLRHHSLSRKGRRPSPVG
jgi:chloramphenicol-sensitive protein RarD